MTVQDPNDIVTRFNLKISHSEHAPADKQAIAPTYSGTPHGIRICLPVMDFSEGVQVAIYIGLLYCTTETRYRGPGDITLFHLALILQPCPGKGDNGQSLYQCGSTVDNRIRLVHISEDNMHEFAQRWSWKTLFITAMPPFRSDMRLSRTIYNPSVYKVLRFTNMTNAVPFRIPPKNYRKRLYRFCGAMVCNSLIAPPNFGYGWTGLPPISLVYSHSPGGQVILVVCLGVCADSVGAHWAHLHRPERKNHKATLPVTAKHPCRSHDCLQDHISAWDDFSKTFELFPTSVTLKFTVCPISDAVGQTLVMDIDEAQLPT